MRPAAWFRSWSIVSGRTPERPSQVAADRRRSCGVKCGRPDHARSRAEPSFHREGEGLRHQGAGTVGADAAPLPDDRFEQLADIGPADLADLPRAPHGEHLHTELPLVFLPRTEPLVPLGMLFEVAGG